MRHTNWLANIFDWIGEVFERFNPSAFRFLAATLPYLTPVPVAWLTSHSASEFLKFPTSVSFLLVFALEGIGLWFTTMAVDAVVDWVRSKNIKTFSIVILFASVVTIYVLLLVDLNVTLEGAVGVANPAISRVITLLCFLPLITGIGNGYYKLKLETKTDMELSKIHQEELDEKIRNEKSNERLERLRIKYGSSGSKLEIPKQIRKSNGSSGTISKMGRPSPNEERVFSYIDQYYSKYHTVPTFSEVMKDLNLPQSTASRLRNSWLQRR